MQYRQLGTTEMSVSEIGLGCESFIGKTAAETQAMFDLAAAAGVNCLDLYSSDPELRSRVGAALSGRRDKFIIQGHLCSVWENGQYKASRQIDEVKAAFADLLSRLNTDYIDVGMIHYVDSAALWQSIVDGEVMAYARELKKQGVIRSIGLSSHNPEVALAAAQSGDIDVLMFSVNPCYDLQPADEDCEKLWANESYSGELANFDPQRVELYESCQRLGVAITVMKAYGGGELLSDKSPSGRALSPVQCLHYALTRPGVAAVMVGAHSPAELEAALAYESADSDERDFAAALAGFPRISWRGHCMYCSHCAPCPVNIDVAAVNKFYNLARDKAEIPETVREHYAALAAHAGDCIACGGCETRCPFAVPVRECMSAAAELFGY